jgi:hypothetical protein
MGAQAVLEGEPEPLFHQGLDPHVRLVGVGAEPGRVQGPDGAAHQDVELEGTAGPAQHLADAREHPYLVGAAGSAAPEHQADTLTIPLRRHPSAYRAGPARA